MISKSLYICFISVLCVFSGYTQNGDLQKIVADSVQLNDEKITETGKINFGVTTGMSYTSFAKGMGSTGTFVYPNANLHLTENLQLDIGTYFLTSNFSGFQKRMNDYPDFLMGKGTYQTTSGFVNARATFDVSEKIHIQGFLMRGFGSNDQLLQNYYNNMSMMGIGVNYEILPNLSIGAQLNYYNTPSYYSPFSPYYFNPVSPVHSDYDW